LSSTELTHIEIIRQLKVEIDYYKDKIAEREVKISETNIDLTKLQTQVKNLERELKDAEEKAEVAVRRADSSVNEKLYSIAMKADAEKIKLIYHQRC